MSFMSKAGIVFVILLVVDVWSGWYEVPWRLTWRYWSTLTYMLLCVMTSAYDVYHRDFFMGALFVLYAVLVSRTWLVQDRPRRLIQLEGRARRRAAHERARHQHDDL